VPGCSEHDTVYKVNIVKHNRFIVDQSRFGSWLLYILLLRLHLMVITMAETCGVYVK
jgi:hypothetical protein